jgi:hypothetical protein
MVLSPASFFYYKNDDWTDWLHFPACSRGDKFFFKAGKLFYHCTAKILTWRPLRDPENEKARQWRAFAFNAFALIQYFK